MDGRKGGVVSIVLLVLRALAPRLVADVDARRIAARSIYIYVSYRQ
jgi:hypothetical protein